MMPTMPRHFELSLLPRPFALFRLAPTAPAPAWATQGPFSSIPRTGDELSIVCEQSLVPAEVQLQSSWRVRKVHGPFVLTENGVLSALASPLAEARLSLLAISTFDTDYLLVASETISAAISNREDI
ncbi:MAG: ACT domain-containing protein [Acidobacteria bacterium]|nr:MAG: ACT domain-containing protein [Acidobacteriota bacterium]PYT85260.1 MAG: ACT domain-containing protein [Acidobacteriota bacterium]